jgi:hypothetical protein
MHNTHTTVVVIKNVINEPKINVLIICSFIMYVLVGI